MSFSNSDFENEVHVSSRNNLNDDENVLNVS